MDIIRILEKAGTWNGTVAEAEGLYAAVRERYGFKRIAAPILSAPGSNYKMDKNDIPTWGLSLAQAMTSVLFNVCRWSTAACRAVCVGKNGHGEMPAIKRGRIAKTVFLGEHPEAFLFLLERDIRRVQAKMGANCAFRLNVFSDIPWVRFLPADLFDTGIFYSYTKAPTIDNVGNSYTAISITERHTDADILALATVAPVAIVADIKRGLPIPEEWLGLPTVDGDARDIRDEPVGTAVILRGKGRLREGRANGFIRPVPVG